MFWRHGAAAVVLALLTALLASCWDKIEMNELALVSMVGLDRDPESGIYTIWLQIVNPTSGASAKGTPGGEQSPVYTYGASGRTLAEAQASFYNLMPRKMFIHHAKAVLISSRATRQGMKDFMNFSELQSEARMSVPLLVVDGSIGDVMRTFTPLERNPGDSLTSRLKLLADYTLKSGRQADLRDVIERTARDEPIVLPVVAATPGTGDINSWEASASIDANRNQLRINGGAVIRNFRMVGRLNEDELVLYHLLDGERGQFVRRVPFRDGHVTVSMENREAKRQLSWVNGKPVVRLKLRVNLSTLSMNEFHPQTLAEIRELESAVNEALADELTDFAETTRGKGWDLLRIRSLLRRKAPDLPDPDRAADAAKIRIEVESRLTGMGNLSRLYEGSGEKR